MKRSPRQKAASERAWTILRLRGAYNFFKEINFNEGMVVVNRRLIEMRARPEKEPK